MSDTKISEAHKLAYETGMYYSQNEKCQPGVPFYAFTQSELDSFVEKVANLSGDGEAVAVAAGISQFGVLECNLLPGGLEQLQANGGDAKLYLHPQPAELSLDVGAMLTACVPGGSIVDPQVVADNIRAWAAERKPAELADLYRHLLDMLGAKDHEDAGRIIGELHGKSLNCTCPSGDGSLRWPCPKHPPESAELAEPSGISGELGVDGQVVEQQPYGWVMTGPNGELFLPLAAREVMEVSAKYMAVVPVYIAPPAQGIDLGRALGIMWNWQEQLGGHVFDARDVARTLTSSDMQAIGVDARACIDATDRNQAIVMAKREIVRALIDQREVRDE